jgi:CrcB protein
MSLKLALIAAGGAVGSLARYGLQGWVQRFVGARFESAAGFPFGTMTVNVLGCVVIGAIAGALSGTISLREEYRVGLTVGLLGGFTTFSALGYESFALAQASQVRWAATNMIASCVLGFIAVWCGYHLAARWFAVT